MGLYKSGFALQHQSFLKNIIGAKWVQILELNALLLWRSIDAHLQIRISNLCGG